MFCSSVDLYMQLFAQGEFQPPPLKDIYRETERRYNSRMPYPNPLSPSHRAMRGQQATLPYHSHAFCKSRQDSQTDLLSRSSRSYTVHTTQLEVPGADHELKLEFPAQVRIAIKSFCMNAVGRIDWLILSRDLTSHRSERHFSVLSRLQSY